MSNTHSIECNYQNTRLCVLVYRHKQIYRKIQKYETVPK